MLKRGKCLLLYSVVSHCRVFIEHDFPSATILHALEAAATTHSTLDEEDGSPQKHIDATVKAADDDDEKT